MKHEKGLYTSSCNNVKTIISPPLGKKEVKPELGKPPGLVSTRHTTADSQLQFPPSGQRNGTDSIQQYAIRPIETFAALFR